MAKTVEILREFQEDFTGYVGVISSDHSYIHKGIGFKANIEVGSISAAYDICFTTPSLASGKFIHFRPTDFTTSANYIGFQLTEGETFTGGTSIVPINSNRTSTKTTEMQAFVKNATCTPSGTIIAIGGLGTSGNPTARAGGKTGEENELLLKANTTYCLTITPAGATTVTATLFWYEEEGM